MGRFQGFCSFILSVASPPRECANHSLGRTHTVISSPLYALASTASKCEMQEGGRGVGGGTDSLTVARLGPSVMV